MPKPQLADELFSLNGDGLPILGEAEPAFDAANVLRIGNDLIYQVSCSGNEAGLRWPKNTVGLFGDLRVHPLRGLYGGTHIDTTIVLLRPGLVMLNPERVPRDSVPELFKSCDCGRWPPVRTSGSYSRCPGPDHSEAGPDRFRQAARAVQHRCGPDPPAGTGERRAPPRECDLAHCECFFRLRAGPPLTTVIAYIDEHRGQFGVQPACRILREHGVAIAPGTYYAARKRPPSARAVRDAWLLAEITRVHKESGEVYGARKVWLQAGQRSPGRARRGPARAGPWWPGRDRGRPVQLAAA